MSAGKFKIVFAVHPESRLRETVRVKGSKQKGRNRLEKKSTWENYTPAQIKACHEFCNGYLDFLSNGKTERECVELILAEMQRLQRPG